MDQCTVTCVLVCVTWIVSLSNADPFLLFANHRNIQIIDVKSSRSNASVVISGMEDSAAVDFIYDDAAIYWSDVSLEVIKMVYLNDTKNPKVVVSVGVDSPDGLACDWVGRKLYWTDSMTNRIEVSNLDGQHRKVLFWHHIDQPRAIALDPQNGYMYWTDWGETPKIEKAGMDGNEDTRSVIINDNIFWPNGLTIDYEASKLYWADGKLGYIHSCDFDGKNRHSVIDGSLPHPFALTLFENQLYWTDWQNKSIKTCNKLTGADGTVVLDQIYSPMDIHAFMKSRQPVGRNMCGGNNGGCSHLCLLSPLPPYFTCACPTGVKLLANNRTCANGPEKMLLLARRSDIRKISLDTSDYTDVALQLKDVSHAIILDYDIAEGMVYWTDEKIKKIQRAYLNGSGQEAIVTTEVDNPDGLAIDWIAKNLYWTDTGTDRIEVSRLNGSSRKVLISDGLLEPRAICLNPVDGYMYWADWGKPPAIERAFLDGTNRTVIVSSEVGWPNGLAVDIVHRKLYWGDAQIDRIEVADLDGSNRRILVSQNLPHIFSFALVDEFIYWTDWQSRTLERVNRYTGLNRTIIIDQLPDVMGIVAVDIHRPNGTNTCAGNNGNCSHLCLYRPQPLNHICACPMGLELTYDGHTCIVPVAFLLFSGQSDIHRVSLLTNQQSQVIPIPGAQKATAIDFDISDGRIYWTDVELQHISRAFMNGSSAQNIIQFGLDFPEGMAVDWVAHNIYWADTRKNRIEVARLDGSSRKVLVWSNLLEPKAIAVDPPNGYIYWTTLAKENQALERAHLNGTNRRKLLNKIGRTQDLTIDYVERRLYWTNLDTHSIMSCDMNGDDLRQVVQSDIQEPMGLSIYQDYVYWTDLKAKTIERANKVNGLNRTLIQENVDFAMDLLVFHNSRQFGTNACGQNNGGCSHLCLAHPANESNTTHHCACPTHYTLNSDRLTCSAPKQYLLLSTKNTTIRLVIENVENVVNYPEVVLPIHGMRNIKAIEYDPVGEYLYWIEGKHKIRRAYDNGTKISTFVTDSENVFQPYDIAIDPYARTLYWTCQVKDVINVTRIGNVSIPIGVIMPSSPSFKPRSLVLYPEKGKLYFTNMITPPRIEVALMDGSERHTLFDSVLYNPQSLTIDTKERNLYWVDSNLGRIEYSDLTGGNRRVLVDHQIGSSRGLAVFGKFLYWLGKESFVERIHKKGNKRLWVRGRIPGLSDMIAVEHSISASWHPCYNNSGGCSHICFITEDKKVRCSCPVHLVLKSDKQTCAEPPTCAADMFKCHSGGVQCIPLVWKCDYHSECEDNSDELNCVTCNSNQFKCASGQCIDKKYKCDGRKNCDDESDEKDCCTAENCDCADCQTPQECKDSNGNLCPSKGPQPGPSKTSKDYTIAIVVVVVFLLVVIGLILVCRHKSNSVPLDEDIGMVKKPLNPQVPSVQDGSSPQNTLSRGKSQATGISMGSESGPPFYDRNHVTGASSSSSSVTQYPQETLNPPPSPVTDRSVYTAPVGDINLSLNSLPSSVPRAGSGGRRRMHKRHHHHHHHHPIPPPPTTPCSTDVCEDSEPYYQTVPLHTSTPSNNKYSNRSSRTRSSRSSSKKFKYYINSTAMELNYDSDPYPPPPTPRSHYYSDVSCPPSPSTERSFFNPYPPPPSPVATSDC